MGRRFAAAAAVAPLNRCVRSVARGQLLVRASKSAQRAALGFAALPLQFASRPRRQAFLHRSQKGAGKVAPRILYPPRLHRSAVPAAR